MAELADLLTLNNIDPSQTQAFADSLAQREPQTRLFEMSQLSGLNRLAKSQRDADTAGRKFLAKALENQRSRAETKAWRDAQLGMNQANIDARKQAREDLEAYRKEQLRLKQLEIDTKAAKAHKTYPKMPAKQQGQYIESKRLSEVITGLNEDFSKLNKAQLEQLDQPALESAISYLPNSLERLAEEKVFDDPEVRSYLSKGRRLESRISQLASGLAVTGFEMSDRQRWSPFAPGVSSQERQQRLQNLQKDLFSQSNAMADFYGQAPVGVNVETDVIIERPEGISEELWSQYDAGQQRMIAERLGAN